MINFGHNVPRNRPRTPARTPKKHEEHAPRRREVEEPNPEKVGPKEWGPETSRFVFHLLPQISFFFLMELWARLKAELLVCDCKAAFSSELSPPEVVVARPGSCRSMVDTESAQLAQCRVLKALGKPTLRSGTETWIAEEHPC